MPNVTRAAGSGAAHACTIKTIQCQENCESDQESGARGMNLGAGAIDKSPAAKGRESDRNNGNNRASKHCGPADKNHGTEKNNSGTSSNRATGMNRYKTPTGRGAHDCTVEKVHCKANCQSDQENASVASHGTTGSNREQPFGADQSKTPANRGAHSCTINTNQCQENCESDEEGVPGAAMNRGNHGTDRDQRKSARASPFH